MLFRNYNWPLVRAKEFFSIYIHHQRRHKSVGAAMSQLKALGYDIRHPTEERSNSYLKWRNWDRNYAYSFFLDRVVGLRFFTPGPIPIPNQAPDRWCTNLYRSDALTHSAQFTLDEKSFLYRRRYLGSPPGAYVSHEINPRKGIPNGPEWKANRNHVFRENDLSIPFRAAPGWGNAWAHCYIFNPSGVSVGNMDPYVPIPPPPSTHTGNNNGDGQN